jgi:glycosyltransferase involved in cell wall biosynthesis
MNQHEKPIILIISSYPPRECGIATFSQDLIKALRTKFKDTFEFKICALETSTDKHQYTNDVIYLLDTETRDSYLSLAEEINRNTKIKLINIQHEFGFFHNNENDFLFLLNSIKAPKLITYHTVLPFPNESRRLLVRSISDACCGVTVMTQNAAEILAIDYGLVKKNISIIPHGTHLIDYSDKNQLKEKYGFKNKKVLSTFGLISSGKSIETTLKVLKDLVKVQPDILFLVIGKTHPTVIKNEGEIYRKMLVEKVLEYKLEKHVEFINYYLPLETLLEYLQLTDIYLFTSKDPNQAVSGTFSYAMSCGCPIISTSIPHAKEFLKDESGILIDFENEIQLREGLDLLLNNSSIKDEMGNRGLQKIIPTAWENSAISHAKNYILHMYDQPELVYNLPPMQLNHIKSLSEGFGMIQFSNINKPDISSGYTLDDNARAMIAMCMHYEETEDNRDLFYIKKYINFIEYCLQADGSFLNYVDENKNFTEQNAACNLDDSNGRAIWSLGYLISLKDILPNELVNKAINIIDKGLLKINRIHSSRAIAFSIKGIYYYNSIEDNSKLINTTELLANRLRQMYKHEADSEWKWFESYLTYGNSILSEGMLCAYLTTGIVEYQDIAKESFDFLLSHTFTKDKIKIISNKGWKHKGQDSEIYGEQPIDVAYTIIALGIFSDMYEDAGYLEKMNLAFTWFLGNNHLNQIMYNPKTGGCYDGLEEHHININQGAESGISYLLSRLMVEKYLKNHLQATKMEETQKAEGIWQVLVN